MNKLLKKALFLTLALALILSCTLTFASAAPTTYSQERNSGTRDEVCTTLSGTSAASYYTGQYTYDNLASQSESQLLNSLRTLMTSTHSYRSSYDDCRDYASYTDCENGDGRVLLLYTSYSATTSQWNGWNREHVWPQSLGGGNTSGGGADLHHVRPSDAGVNSSRGNKKYGEVGSGASYKEGSNPAIGYLGGYYNNTYFEPLDNVKGDVARICLYVYTRWGSGWGADSLTEVFQSIDVLLEWCALDPVDTWEMGRNEVVYGIQGNRNVFIDYPELAWIMLGEEVPEDMTTPSGEGSEGNTSGGSSSGGTTTCDHSSTTVIGKVNVTCTVNGYTGDVTCTKCNVIVTKGSIIYAEGHSYGDPVVTKPPTYTETGEAEKTCSKCNNKVTIIISSTGESLSVEIVSNNVYYSNTLNLMYAVRSPEGYTVALKIYDSIGNLVEIITGYTMETVNGENLKAFTSAIGVPAQNIDTEFFAVAELYDGEKLVSASDMEKYSVLEYLYERLNVSTNVTDAQKTMYKTLLTYANDADVVVNKDRETNISKYAYVLVTNGTVGESYSTDMMLDGTSLDSVKPLVNEDGKILKWMLTAYALDGTIKSETYTDADLKTITVNGSTAYILTAIYETVVKPTTEKTYSYTFGAKQFSANGTKDLGGVNWTLSGSGGGYWGYDGTKGQQLGSGNAPYKSMTLTLAEFKNVSKVTINTSGAKDISGTVNVYVGDTLVGTIKLTSTATEYSFDVSGVTGEVRFEYTQTSSKALYVKSITVDYAE